MYRTNTNHEKKLKMAVWIHPSRLRYVYGMYGGLIKSDDSILRFFFWRHFRNKNQNHFEMFLMLFYRVEFWAFLALPSLVLPTSRSCVKLL